MPHKRGIEMAAILGRRPLEHRGGKRPRHYYFDTSDPKSLSFDCSLYLDSLKLRHYSPNTIAGRAYMLHLFLAWAETRELFRADVISKATLESYQRHLYRHKKDNGKPLSIATQQLRLVAVRELFRWLCREGRLPFNPGSELELPRRESRLPQEPLSVHQIEQILNEPDISEPLGLRDRAMMEVLYSSALRRTELVELCVYDINHERRTLQVRQGKGNKDRVVPIGDRALLWVEQYEEKCRSHLLCDPSEQTLFLNAYGEAFSPAGFGTKVASYMRQAGIEHKGGCHLFRHSCATHMLENGADVRFIQQLLGHVDLNTTQIYTQVSIKELQKIHAKTHPAKMRE